MKTKLISLIGALVCTLSTSTLARSPEIPVEHSDDTLCPVTFSCGSVDVDGFNQRQLTDADGDSYFQTILTARSEYCVGTKTDR